MTDFSRIGKRDIKIQKIESHVLENKGMYCSGCGCGPLDGATGVSLEGDTSNDPIMPYDGSPTICGYCGILCVYRLKDVLTMELPKDEDIKRWKDMPDNFWEGLEEIKRKLLVKIQEARIRGELRYGKGNSTRFT